MIKLHVTLLTFLLAFSLSYSYAETFTWTDEQGTVHFTEDLEKVPKEMRNKAKAVVDSEQPQKEKLSPPTPSAKDSDATLQAAPSDKDGKSSPAETYAGKTFDQWEKDFRDREAAMTAVRKRMAEITDLLRNSKFMRNEREILLAEHTSLLAQFNEMKAQYNQQVEIARKAGIQINIQQ